MKILIEESVLRQALELLETSVPKRGYRLSEETESITALRSALDAAEKVEPEWNPDGTISVDVHPLYRTNQKETL